MPHKLSRRLAVACLAPLIAVTVIAAAAASAPGTISFTGSSYTVDEQAGSTTVTLRRTGGADGEVTAKVTLADVTTVPADYQFAPGALDFSFNSVPKTNNLVRTVIQQPDGKVIIGGSFTHYGGVARAGVARLNGNGTLDTTFAPPAVTGTDVYALALQPDGKLLVGGLASHMFGAGVQTGVTRLNADGTPDSSFKPGTGSGSNAVTHIALQADGKIMIVGYFSSFNGVSRYRIARLNADGAVDTTFDPAGGPVNSNLESILIQPDGKILVGGSFTQFGTTARKNLARLNPDGSVDTSFDAGDAAKNFIVFDLALLPDGKVMAAGGFYYGLVWNGANPSAVVRLGSDGSLDPTFADPGLGVRFFTFSIVRQPDGKLLLGGHYFPEQLGGQVFHALERLNADGADDPTFKSGITAHSNSTISQLALQPDGKILIGGRLSLHPFGEPYAYLMRLEGDLFVTWGAGDSADKSVRLPIVNDTSAEEDETLNLTVTPLTGGAAAGDIPSASLTIFDNDGKLEFGSATYGVGEAAGAALVPVTRVGGASVTSTVNYTVSTGSAISGSDFTGSTGTLTFAPGETSKNISVTILDDNFYELDETVNLRIDTVTNGAIGLQRTSVLTLLNDDPVPSISIDDVTVTEGDSGTKLATFTVTRTGATGLAVTFQATSSDGTAVVNNDYATLANSFGAPFQLNSGASSMSLSVAVYGDTIIEEDENFFITISSPQFATIGRAQGVGTIKDNDTSTGVPTVQFGAREFKAQEGAGALTVTVTRSGDASSPTNVNYSTNFGSWPSSAGLASDRNDYTFTAGTLRFAAGETSKTFQVFITDDAFVEGDELFSMALSGPTGGTGLGTPAASAAVRIIDNDAAPTTANPVDDTAFFVRQHYRDFLGRDPDASGLAHWVNEIEQCGADAACREVKRINVSAAFFLSIEFQETGYFDYLLYKAAFNTGERVSFRTFQNDTLQLGRDVVVGADGWEQQLASNKQAFADSFVARSNFLAAYPQSMSAAQFVDALNNNTGDPLNPTAGGSLTQAERDGLATDLAAGRITRAQVLRSIAENAEFRRRHLSKAFVLMQYFGYLRRAPNDLPDSSFDGYNFWLGKLNEFNGNYIAAEMVKAFISSDEYRKRFGQ